MTANKASVSTGRDFLLFSPPGGRVAVRVRADRGHPVVVPATITATIRESRIVRTGQDRSVSCLIDQRSAIRAVGSPTESHAR